jgi:hypothetical protein
MMRKLKSRRHLRLRYIKATPTRDRLGNSYNILHYEAYTKTLNPPPGGYKRVSPAQARGFVVHDGWDGR